jgi:thiol:disulfide interchange protein DsbG
VQAEELPEAIKKIEAKGAKIVGQFDAPDGLRGYAAQYQNRGMALYLTPDGKHVLLGNLYDAEGNDLSSAPLQKLVYAPMAKKSGASSKRAAGSATATRMPRASSTCSAIRTARTATCSGNRRGHGSRPARCSCATSWSVSSAKTARQVRRPARRQGPAKALADHEAAGKGSSLKALKDVPPAIQAKLAANMQLMEDLELQATPAIFYMDDKGELQQQQGAPSPDKLVKILGPK